MDDWELREPAICRALAEMQYDAMGSKDTDDIITSCRVSSDDYSRIYGECFSQIERFIRSLKSEMENLNAQVKIKNKQIQGYRNGTVFEQG